jgi:Ribbon-helix-helix protein, copG family
MGDIEPEKPLRTRSGRVLTPEIIEELAAEAERGYDLSKARVVAVGRPSLSGNGTSPRLSLRIAPDVYEAASRRAKKEGLSMSELARRAIARYVAS